MTKILKMIDWEEVAMWLAFVGLILCHTPFAIMIGIYRLEHLQQMNLVDYSTLEFISVTLKAGWLYTLIGLPVFYGIVFLGTAIFAKGLEIINFR